jgi:LmbE family N-acetylglucosaminyl deacetylase
MHRDHEYIQILAYRIWEARGRPEGSANQDWLEAERQLAAADAAPSAAASEMPDTQMNTMTPPKTKLSATATVRAPAGPGQRSCRQKAGTRLARVLVAVSCHGARGHTEI